jgi:hypothetical protein
MQKILFLLLILFFPFVNLPVAETAAAEPSSDSKALYEELGLAGNVDFAAFRRAVDGYYRIDGRKKEVLTFIDFSKPSTDKRLWVIDMSRRRVLFNSYVAHGQGSGDNYATSFSNRSGSHQSSLGFFLTGNTYIGGNGYSLVIDGLEPGINDNARSRSVVIHGAAYANPSVIASAGRLGRSWGCPALPEAITRDVIDAIKGGSVLYIHADQPEYLAQSTILAKADTITGS